MVLLPIGCKCDCLHVKSCENKSNFVTNHKSGLGPTQSVGPLTLNCILLQSAMTAMMAEEWARETSR